jgi:hypothetical protein
MMLSSVKVLCTKAMKRMMMRKDFLAATPTSQECHKMVHRYEDNLLLRLWLISVMLLQVLSCLNL